MSYICYLLNSVDGRRTYVGMTNNFTRRLRQHNGELVGGARYTSRPNTQPWRPVATVHGFENKIDALRFEWWWKHQPPRNAHGVKARIAKAQALLAKPVWTRTPPLELKMYGEEVNS